MSQFKFKGRDDGTPSMGSSFSDLDGIFSPIKIVAKTKRIQTRYFRHTKCIGRSSSQQHASWRHGKPNEHHQSSPQE
ncbi:hypothetical protein GcC1_030014 [Golovinomyces cichoracearum]|uniref:Uncharacterized protein n=1 Tax=Golovinomyces cichoracearum TaxID=62708 RepID=A0A420J2M3_9PEZI|nr:hypothetical protein GcC1_030014 [Golovinomyces cichoracearum]